eukprot:TRINITY_DN1632_c0_g3_i1.p1 TRINITY_DN1632_c0_g3~~TRINITY_DN1632_c0_g3_i1.p1  ORF type:complete len:134 (+),score=22.42 TRINITY_DN1632_c0_g3_i1:508-909(+)
MAAPVRDTAADLSIAYSNVFELLMKRGGGGYDVEGRLKERLEDVERREAAVERKMREVERREREVAKREELIRSKITLISPNMFPDALDLPEPTSPMPPYHVPQEHSSLLQELADPNYDPAIDGTQSASIVLD